MYCVGPMPKLSSVEIWENFFDELHLLFSAGLIFAVFVGGKFALIGAQVLPCSLIIAVGQVFVCVVCIFLNVWVPRFCLLIMFFTPLRVLKLY